MREVRALLLAAGLGTRLRPLTDHWPKCLMPIGERPLLEYWLETLWQSGVREVLVNLHYLSTVVEEFLDRPRFQGWVHSVRETELLGTAGTLRANADFFQGMYGAAGACRQLVPMPVQGFSRVSSTGTSHINVDDDDDLRY